MNNSISINTIIFKCVGREDDILVTRWRVTVTECDLVTLEPLSSTRPYSLNGGGKNEQQQHLAVKVKLRSRCLTGKLLCRLIA